MADAYGRAARIDSAVDEAQKGPPKQPMSERPQNKPMHERMGMTREEYSRGMKQLADERKREIAREEAISKARRGQSNPGN